MANIFDIVLAATEAKLRKSIHHINLCPEVSSFACAEFDSTLDHISAAIGCRLTYYGYTHSTPSDVPKIQQRIAELEHESAIAATETIGTERMDLFKNGYV